MSKIVGPIALATQSLAAQCFIPPSTACWWRLRLESNEQGNKIVLRSDATGEDWSDATWVEWEFFDDHDTILDIGMDRPNCKARMAKRGHQYFLDMLHDGPPTPSQKWRMLTWPGLFTHPDDEEVSSLVD